MSLSDGPPKKRRSLPSMISRLSDSMSLKSRTSSVFAKMQKGILGAEHAAPQMKLQWRDWLIAVAELCMSFSWGSFMARAQSERTMKMRQITPRMETVQRLFWNGWAGIGCLLMGHLADSYTRNYGIVIINVSAHFTLSSLFFMSEIINRTASEDEYGLLLSDIFVWLYIPIRATDFARLVYGMEQLVGKSSYLILRFAFVMQLADLSGAFLFQVLNSSGMSFQFVTFVAFTANGVVLFLYAYVVRPQKFTNVKFSRGIASKLWGCVITALTNKKKFGPRIKKKSWLDFAETRYEKGHILKTKNLMKLFLLILPSVGFLLFNDCSGDFFDLFWTGLNRSGRENTYRIWIVNSATLLTMLVFELLMVPLLAGMNVKLNFYRRFLLGYLALIFALLFAAVTMTMTEKLYIGRDLALLRMFNTRNRPVDIASYDMRYSVLNYTVANHSSRLVNYQTRNYRMLRVNVHMYDEDSYTQHFLLQPYAMVGYLFVDPDVVYRISGLIPVLEAPPGLNSREMPRCFVTNFITGKAVVLDMENAKTGEKSSVPLTTGEVIVFQVEEGTYRFRVRETTARVAYEVLIGGVYGVYIYVDLEDYRIHVDKIIPENKTPALMGFGVSIPMGMAKGVGLVALLAFVFTNAPEGLTGIAVGYLFFLSQLSSWALLFGFYTWHRYLSGYALLLYSLIATCLFFGSFVLVIKYRNLYKTYFWLIYLEIQTVIVKHFPFRRLLQ